MLKKRKIKKLPFKVILPNMITSGNLLCGMLALILTFHNQFIPAALLVFIAMVFDYLDGKIARQLGGSSLFGLELDSLADLVSFCVAPAVLLYALQLKEFGIIGALAASFFALCGALRLARFNVQSITSCFVGLPTPAAGGVLASLVLGRFDIKPFLSLLFVLFIALLMISNFSYSNLKYINKENIKIKGIVLGSSFIFLSLVILKEKAILFVMLVYVLSGVLGINLKKLVADVEGEVREAEES